MTEELLPIFKSLMKSADKDGNDRLTEEELDKASVSAELHKSAYPLVCALKRNFDAIQKLSKDDGVHEKGISVADVAQLDLVRKQVKEKRVPLDNEYDKLQTSIVITPIGEFLVVKPGNNYLRTNTAKNFDNVRNEAADMVRNTSRQLFADKDPLTSIKPEAVIQGPRMANCYFMSAVASLAATNPKSIRDMIKENKDGTYTVKFPGADKAVSVTAPTDAERFLFAQGSEHGTWPQVLEKAYGVLCDTWSNPWGGGLPQESTNSGSALHHGLRMMSGKWVRKWENTVFSSYASMDKRLAESFSEGTPVTAYIKREIAAMIGAGLGVTKEVTVDGFQMGHEFAITAYKANPSNPKNGLITVYDPLKRESRKITLEKFFDNFSGLAFPDR